MSYFKNKILLGEGRCEKTNMQASGIPDHLSIVQKINCLEKKVQSLQQVLFQRQDEMQRDIQEEQKAIRMEILAVLAEIPQQLKSMMLENFVIEGVAPLSIRDLERLMTERDENLLARITNSINSSRTQLNVGAEVTTTQTVSDRRQPTEFIFFNWGGKLRMVPEKFLFPIFDAATMFNLWFFGNSELKIQPYKHLGGHLDDLKEKTNKNNFHRAKLVMTEIDNIIRDNHLLGHHNSISEVESISAQNNIFDVAYEKLIKHCYDNPLKLPKRPNDITVSTLAAKLYDIKKKQRL